MHQILGARPSEFSRPTFNHPECRCMGPMADSRRRALSGAMGELGVVLREWVAMQEKAASRAKEAVKEELTVNQLYDTSTTVTLGMGG